MATKLGNLQRQREIWVLQIIYHFDDYDDYYDERAVPTYEIMRQIDDVDLFRNSQPPSVPSLYTLYCIAQDLSEYGLIKIHGDNGWYRYEITPEGKGLVESYEATQST